ncbi:hypothetical protein [Cupriavidus alkaliphilus]
MTVLAVAPMDGAATTREVDELRMDLLEKRGGRGLGRRAAMGKPSQR